MDSPTTVSPGGISPSSRSASRSASAESGPSRFQSRDVASEQDFGEKAEKAKAQTPEELRRKLAKRKEADSQGGKAVFQSKDLSDDPNKHR
ncbi:MAG: hypothetical protein AAF525_22700 [Pseudomonadota bacterium]